MEPPSSTDPLPIFSTFTTAHLVGFLILVVLLIFSALLSGAETAYFSLSKDEVDNLQKGESKVIVRVRRLLDKPEHLLNSILLLNTIVNVTFIILSFYLFTSFAKSSLLLGDFVVLALLIGTILLLFGEVIPKILAYHGSLTFACFVATPLSVASKIAGPFSRLVGKIGVKSKHNGKNESSIDDLSDAISVVQSGSDEDKRLLKGIVGMVDTSVTEIMRPRVDVSAVDVSLSFDELYEKVVDWNYSRIPVFDGTIDSIKGVLYIKDLLPYLNTDVSNFHWQDIIRAAHFVSEEKYINDLLSEFQQKKIHMAIVVDEYGGTSGIVTLEDILEEIVGEIADETDTDEDIAVRAKDGSMLFEGKTTIGDFSRAMGIDDDPFEEIEEDVETLAGLVLQLKGGFPVIGEELSFGRFTFRVEDVDSRRVKKVRVIENTDEE